jgi:LacI family transcriptional regulator
MVKRPTLVDLAKASGVSIATVDRVLNRRLPVSDDTTSRVVRAAEEIGFHATHLLKLRAQEKPLRRFGFLLQKKYAFYENFGRNLVEATKLSADIKGKPVLEFMDELVPAVIAKRMADMASRVDAMAIVAMDHPLINHAVEEIAARGKPVFTLLSPINTSAATGHLGLDSRKCGRIAGWIISQAAHSAGHVGILVGSHRYLNHEISESSFRSYLREYAPQLQLLEPIINLDDERIAYEAVSDMMKAYPELQGIYVTGGGQEGLIRALRDSDNKNRPVAVCNELTDVTRAALIDGIIHLALATPIDALAQRTIEQMISATVEHRPNPGTSLFAPEIIVRENL